MDTELPVSTDGLTKTYGDLVAVDHLDLTVRAGEIYGFLGPNGAGKTTTLRMLLGLIRPTSGTVRIFGGKPGPQSLRRVGALIEGPAFYPFLSGEDNLRSIAARIQAPASRIAEVLDRVDLTGRRKDRYSGYSLGMKQRLGLAAALLKEPALIILDEPTNGLDPAGMAEMRVVLRRLADEGCTVLLSSHLLGEVQQICDRFGVINHGTLLTERSVGDLAAGPLQVRAEPTSVAVSLATRLLGADRVTVRTEAGRDEVTGLSLDIPPEQVPGLAREFITAGVDLHELHRSTPDLESLFFELTGGTTHVA